MNRADINEQLCTRIDEIRANHIWKGFPATPTEVIVREIQPILDQVEAEALREFAENKVTTQTAGRIYEDLHTEADRIGGEQHG